MTESVAAVHDLDRPLAQRVVADALKRALRGIAALGGLLGIVLWRLWTEVLAGIAL